MSHLWATVNKFIWQRITNVVNSYTCGLESDEVKRNKVRFNYTSHFFTKIDVIKQPMLVKCS